MTEPTWLHGIEFVSISEEGRETLTALLRTMEPVGL
jgi:hypothetical protein